MPERQAGNIPHSNKSPAQQGKNWLLVIGIDKYDHHKDLDKAVADAKGFYDVMTKRYGFEELTEPLYNDKATQRNIREAMGKCEKLEEHDRLIIFYAGHGWYRPQAKLGYIVSSEAKDNPHIDFISTSFLTDTFKVIEAKHILLIVDCCFGGSFGNERNVNVKETNRVAKNLDLKRSRMVLASGGIEPVKDGYASSNNSPFMTPLLDILKSNEQPLTILSNVFPLLRERTNLNAEQMPLYKPLYDLGHDNGELALYCSDLDTPEEKAYKAAIIADNIDIYEDFLLNDEFINVEFEEDITQRLSEKRAFEAWKRIENSEHIEDFIDFIKRFSNSLFVDLAKTRREDLKKIKADKRQAKEVEQQRQLEVEKQRIELQKQLEKEQVDNELRQKQEKERKENAERVRLEAEKAEKARTELQKQAEKEIEEGKKVYRDKDYTKGFSLLFKHRYNEAFDSDAQVFLGYIFQTGNGVKQDYAEAIKWFQKAAEQGNASGQHNLGVMYSIGDAIEQDFKEAVKWYQKAAEQGDAYGQSALGLMYENGKGVEQDYKEAVKWYQKAAEQGNAIAQGNLAELYENGKAVTKDINEALRLYRLSAKQGNQYAKDALKRLGYPE